ncbi:MAG: extracellular solute-binding protein [Treponema sp.]|jgi:multiple sugar transport system substrate-binding protein|nr:extracellular solute-binding protein [Treponema sp.]
MKKILFCLLTLCLSAALFAGGQGGSSSGGSGSGGTLSIWSWGADLEKTMREEAVKVFARAHPEIKVEHVVLPTADSVWDQKSAAAYAAGNAGDVMQMSPDYYGLMTRYYEDLNPYVRRDNIDLNAVITEGMLEGYYRPSGKLEALPLLANCFVFLYNKDLFDKVGAAYPTDNWTWADVARLAPRFVSGTGINHVYFLVNHWVNPNFATISMGGVPYTNDFKRVLLDSPEVAAGLDLFGQLIKDGALPDDVASQTLPKEQLFVSGKAAVFPAGGFEIATIAEEIGDSFAWDAVLPPKDTNGRNTNITYATGYAMNAAAKNKEAAWLFLKEVSFANDDMARQTMRVGMPANKRIAGGEYSSIKYGPMTNAKYVQGLATSRLNIWGGALARVGDQWTQMWQAVTIEGLSAKAAQDRYFPLVQRAFSELNIE